MEKISLGYLRSKYLQEKVEIEGDIKEIMEPYWKILSAKFECPSCGTIIQVLQIEKKFREPSRCSCGRRKKFKLISKEVDMESRAILCDKPKNVGLVSPLSLSFIGDNLIDKLSNIKEGNRVKIIGELGLEQNSIKDIKPDYVLLVENIEKII